MHSSSTHRVQLKFTKHINILDANRALLDIADKNVFNTNTI